MKPTVTVNEAAALIGCSRRTVYNWIKWGLLEAFHYPRRESLRVVVPERWPFTYQSRGTLKMCNKARAQAAER